MTLVVGGHVALVLMLSMMVVEVPASFSPPPLQTFEIDPPPPPEIILDRQELNLDVQREEALAAPAGPEGLASPVMLPEAVVELPAINPVAAAPLPNIGADARQGSGYNADDGAGAGGIGAGTGAATGGEGQGAGGGMRVSVIERTKFNIWDYNRTSRIAWRDASRVMVVVMVQTSGRATDCEVKVSSGNVDIDSETCRLVEDKVRFRPALDAQGQPYATPFGYIQHRPPVR
ncbi:energy transducer TonB [Sphingomicrobium flavum]|uniref:energy transducer TonB n=1 Tax=Sphingomicrobium flavum TaxID=1229164 RepID=UPI0021AE2770|nr:energy transducer TonB [Sphingomicrobium flavum]